MNNYTILALAAAVLSACATTLPPPSIEEGGITSAQSFATTVVPACESQQFEVYFGTDDTRLSPESDAIIQSMAQTFGTCDIQRIRVTGYADSVGDRETNLEVSEARAKLVAEALISAGLVSQRLDIEAIGEKGALTEDGLSKPLRRKTVVSIET